jgi:hypothetical protein
MLKQVKKKRGGVQASFPERILEEIDDEDRMGMGSSNSSSDNNKTLGASKRIRIDAPDRG